MKTFYIVILSFLVCTTAFSQSCVFTNPIKAGAADPQITYIDGYYYFLFTTGDGVWIRRHQNLEQVGDDQVNGKIKVWPWNSQIIAHVWAPEIHKINNKFYIYACGSITGNNDPASMRMFVLESDTTDPLGSYTFKGLLSNDYAIDASVWKDTTTNTLYMAYSKWDSLIPNANPSSLIQCLYICQMISPIQMGTSVRLSYPSYAWEKHAWWVNEGPYFLQKNSKLHIVFSVSGCASDKYSLAKVTCSNGNYMNASSWVKSTAPIFTKDPTVNVYGTGHHSTVQTPAGQWWLAYHAVSNPSGACDGSRSTRIQPFTFDVNDDPVFGTPVDTIGTLPCPTNLTTAIENNSYNAEILVYPNPAAAQLNVFLPDVASCRQISLYNVSGDLLLMQKVNTSNVQIDLSHFSAGIYFLRANNFMKKVVVYKQE